MQQNWLQIDIITKHAVVGTKDKHRNVKSMVSVQTTCFHDQFCAIRKWKEKSWHSPTSKEAFFQLYGVIEPDARLSLFLGCGVKCQNLIQDVFLCYS